MMSGERAEAMVTLRALAAFVEAARRCGAGGARLDAPALRQIERLERVTGVKLCQASSAGARLTSRGRICLRHAEKILSEVRHFERAFGIGGPRRPPRKLRIGATYSPSARLLEWLLASFRKKQPRAAGVLTTASRQKIEPMLLSGELDIAVVSGHVSSPRLVAEPWRRENLVFFAAPEHPLAAKDKVTPADLASARLVVRGASDGGASSIHVLEQIKRRGFEPRVILRCNSPEAVKRAVRRRGAIGLAYLNVVMPDVRRGDFRCLDVRGLELHADNYIVYVRERPLSEPAQAFRKLLLRYRKAV
jgi:DNA-binding transcriptional LysR family regulator